VTTGFRRAATAASALKDLLLRNLDVRRHASGMHCVTSLPV